VALVCLIPSINALEGSMTDQPVGTRPSVIESYHPGPVVTEHYLTSVTPPGSPAPVGAGLEVLVVAAMQHVAAEQVREVQTRMAALQAHVAGKQQLRYLLGQLTLERSRAQGHPAAYSALVDEAQQALTDQLNAQGELSDTESLRLQMAMDRMSKLMTTLSNILKKASDTDAAITQNLK
jgi:hypothetical protein